MYVLKDFGSYTIGGRLHVVEHGTPFTVNFTRSAAYEVDPRGDFAVEHGYVQYFLPQHRNAEPPVLLVHGGGMSGSCWETTPDGRPGWIQLLLARGYEVHVLDTAERGRAGFAPGLWEGAPLLRSQQEAWTLFRFGRGQDYAERIGFAGQLFPIDAFDAFARSFVPRWLSTTPIQTRVLKAVLRRLGHAIVVCHSQGGELVFDACATEASSMSRIIALEPSAMPDGVTVPVTLCAGDYLDVADHWRLRRDGWRRAARQQENITYLGPSDFGPGNSHMMMMDRNHHQILDLLL